MSHRITLHDFYDVFHGVRVAIFHRLIDHRYLLLQDCFLEDGSSLETAVKRSLEILDRAEHRVSLVSNPLLVNSSQAPYAMGNSADLGVPLMATGMPKYKWGEWPESWLNGRELEGIEIPRKTFEVRENLRQFEGDEP